MDNADPLDTIEQMIVQMAGVSSVALGATRDVAQPGDYGWSPAYQDTLELRRKYDELLASLRGIKLVIDQTIARLEDPAVREALAEIPDEIA